MTYWEIFSKLCHNIGKKPNPVGEDIGVSTATITKWKNGAIPNGLILLRVADYFNVSTDYLLGRTENPHFNAENYIARDNSIQNNVKNGTVNVNTSKEENKEENIVDVIKYKEAEYPFYSHTRCPVCNADIIQKPKLTENITEISFEDCKQFFYEFTGVPTPPSSIGEIGYSPQRVKEKHDTLLIYMLNCPYCREISSYVYDTEHKRKINIYPNTNAKKFPNVPEDIMKDYTEACDILELSPTASATLSRRCLQRMIRNRWGKELKRLVDEIETVPDSNINAIERSALHAVRKIGNIGAHPDQILEVTLNDAKATIKAIEIFLQRWYVDEPKERAELLTLTEMSDKKTETKKESKEKEGEEFPV